MLEFESNKNMEELILFEREFLESLGFGDKDSFPEVNYLDMCEKYQVKELGHEHEMQLYKDYGPVVFLKNFPEYTSPFWNMSRCDNLACKVDVIVCGVETIGSAERSCDPEEMKRLFNTISDGEYANLLYSLFTKERVDAELEEFLQHQFFIRSGAGVGITRLIKAMKQLNLI
jgi:aspartyl/asparaginyl-tRNA synthetase